MSWYQRGPRHSLWWTAEADGGNPGHDGWTISGQVEAKPGTTTPGRRATAAGRGCSRRPPTTGAWAARSRPPRGRRSSGSAGSSARCSTGAGSATGRPGCSSSGRTRGRTRRSPTGPSWASRARRVQHLLDPPRHHPVVPVPQHVRVLDHRPVRRAARGPGARPRLAGRPAPHPPARLRGRAQRPAAGHRRGTGRPRVGAGLEPVTGRDRRRGRRPAPPARRHGHRPQRPLRRRDAPRGGRPGRVHRGGGVVHRRGRAASSAGSATRRRGCPPTRAPAGGRRRGFRYERAPDPAARPAVRRPVAPRGGRHRHHAAGRGPQHRARARRAPGRRAHLSGRTSRAAGRDGYDDEPGDLPWEPPRGRPRVRPRPRRGDRPPAGGRGRRPGLARLRRARRAGSGHASAAGPLYRGRFAGVPRARARRPGGPRRPGVGPGLHRRGGPAAAGPAGRRWASPAATWCCARSPSTPPGCRRGRCGRWPTGPTSWRSTGRSPGGCSTTTPSPPSSPSARTPSASPAASTSTASRSCRCRPGRRPGARAAWVAGHARLRASGSPVDQPPTGVELGRRARADPPGRPALRLPRWQGTSGDRVVRSKRVTGADPPPEPAYKVWAPRWVDALDPADHRQGDVGLRAHRKADRDMAERTIFEGRVVTMNGRSDVHDPGRVYVEGTTIVAVRPAAKPAPGGLGRRPARPHRRHDLPGPHRAAQPPELQRPAAVADAAALHEPGRSGCGHRDYRRCRQRAGQRARAAPAGSSRRSSATSRPSACVGGVTTSQGIALGVEHGHPPLLQGARPQRRVDPTTRRCPRRPPASPTSRRAAPRRSEGARPGVVPAAAPGRGGRRGRPRPLPALRIGTDDWAITPSLCGIHCAGLRGRDYQIFRARGGSMVWSPLSNLLLYGGTADIARAAGRGAADRPRVRLVAVGVEEPAGRAEGGVARVRGPGRGVHAARAGGDGHGQPGPHAQVGRGGRVARAGQARRHGGGRRPVRATPTSTC